MKTQSMFTLWCFSLVTVIRESDLFAYMQCVRSDSHIRLFQLRWLWFKRNLDGLWWSRFRVARWFSDQAGVPQKTQRKFWLSHISPHILLKVVGFTKLGCPRDWVLSSLSMGSTRKDEHRNVAWAAGSTERFERVLVQEWVPRCGTKTCPSYSYSYNIISIYIISFPVFLKSESLCTELLLSELNIVASFLSHWKFANWMGTRIGQVSIPRAFLHFGNFKASQSKGSWRPKFQRVIVQRFWRVSERTKKHEMG